MSITDDIHDVVHAWVTASTGIDGQKAIPDKENSPEPTGSHFVINSSASESGVGFRDEVDYGASGEYTVRGHRERLVSLHAFGKDAYSLMQQVKMSQSAPSIRKLFKDARIELVETKTIRDLSKLKGSRYESRAQMDVIVRYAQKFTDAVPTIARIDYEVSVGLESINDSVHTP